MINIRRAAGVAAAALGLALGALAAPASAATQHAAAGSTLVAPSGVGKLAAASPAHATVVGREAPESIGECTLTNGWGGGFYCASTDPDHGAIWYEFPNGTEEVFVVGLDWSVWTRWNNTSGGLSAWTSLGGQVEHTEPVIGLSGSSWGVTLVVFGTNGDYYYDTRSDSPSGGWTGWYA